MRKKGWVLSILLAWGVPIASFAEEILRPTVESGSWIAMQHQVSQVSPADICLAGDIASGVIFRWQDGTTQIRVSNKDWSLPAGVHGTLVLTVADWTHSFEIDDNTVEMVNSEIPDEIVPTLFEKMDHASKMLVTVGKAKPIVASLSGSTKVTNAFRTCAGITGNVSSPGSNPFQ